MKSTSKPGIPQDSVLGLLLLIVLNNNSPSGYAKSFPLIHPYFSKYLTTNILENLRYYSNKFQDSKKRIIYVRYNRRQ